MIIKTASFGQDRKKPLVSVIVPVYNVEKYLAQCLDSIVGQTYQNLEILLVNDGSTDGSGEICRQYAEKDSRIRLFYQENQGLSGARNTGLDHMTGEYIVFVDSDDYLSTRFVEILLYAQQELEAPIVRSNHINSLGEDGVVDFRIPDEISYSILSRDDIFCLSGKKEIDFSVRVWAGMFEKKIFMDLRFPVGKIHEDEFIFHRIFWQADTVVFLDIGLYAYRLTSNSLSRKDGIPKISPDILEAYLDRLTFAHQHRLERYEEKTMKGLAQYLYLVGCSDDPKIHHKERLKEIEYAVYQISGKRLFSWRYLWFKISPGTLRFTRKLYWKLKHVRSARSYSQDR